MRVVNSLTVQISGSNNMTGATNKKNQAIVPKIPRGLRSLPVVAQTSNVRSESMSLQAEVKEIEEWWSSPRWRLTKRVYSGETMWNPYFKPCRKSSNEYFFKTFVAMDVACLRPSREARGGAAMSPNTSFSDGQSRKLYDLLIRLFKKGGYSHTFGALDPVQAVQMAPHLSSVYVSGWQCSSTASTTNEPGPDFAE